MGRMIDKGPADTNDTRPILSTDADKRYFIELPDGTKQEVKAFVVLSDVAGDPGKVEGFTLANVQEAIIMKNHLGDAVRNMKGRLIAESLGLDPSQVNVIDVDELMDGGTVADITLPGIMDTDKNLN